MASQDYPNIEYIIVDDGCDYCPVAEINEAIAKAKSSTGMDITFIVAKQNVGTVKSVKRAFEKAKGKYIIPLGHDDVFFDAHVISDIVEYFETTNCDMISGLRLAVTEDLKPVRFMPAKHYQEIIKTQLTTSKKQLETIVAGPLYEMASGSTMYYRRSVWEEIGFDERYVLWEDGPFIKNFTQNGGRFSFMFDRICIKYRLGGMSTGSKIHPVLANDGINFKLHCLNEMGRTDDIGWKAKRRLKQECLWILNKESFHYAIGRVVLKLFLALVFPEATFSRLCARIDKYIANKETINEEDLAYNPHYECHQAV